MSRVRRVVVPSLAGVLVLYVAAALLVPFVVDAERFRPRLEGRLEDLLGRKVSLGKLSATLWLGPGIRASHLKIGEPDATPEGGPGPTLTAGSATVRFAILPLLRGEIRARTVAIEGGEVRWEGRALVEGLDLRCRVRRSQDAGLGLEGRLRGGVLAVRARPTVEITFSAMLRGSRLRLESLAMRSREGRLRAKGDIERTGKGALRITLEGAASLGRSSAQGTLAIEGTPSRPEMTFRVTSPYVDFDQMADIAGWKREEPPSRTSTAGGLVPLALASETAAGATDAGILAASRGSGMLEAERGRFAGLEMSSLRSRVVFDSGSLRFEETAFEIYGGKHIGFFEVDLLKGGLPFVLEARLDGVEVDRLVSALSPARGGALQGTASLSLSLRGAAGATPVSRSVRGSGRAELRGGRLASVGILKQVAQMLEMAGGRGIGRDETPFDHLSASFEVGEGQAQTRDLEFRSTDLDLDGEGSVGLDGALRLDVVAAFSRRVSADLVQQTPQLRFRVEPGGRLTVPLRIRGNLSAPAVQLDLDRVLREGMERSLREKGKGSLLRRLLGKD